MLWAFGSIWRAQIEVLKGFGNAFGARFEEFRGSELRKRGLGEGLDHIARKLGLLDRIVGPF